MNANTLVQAFEILKDVLVYAGVGIAIAQKVAALTAGDSDDRFLARLAAGLNNFLALIPAFRQGENIEKVRERKREKRGLPK